MRIRLEEHYYNTLLEDIMILSYDHDSPHATLEALADNDLFNLQLKETYLEKAFTIPLDRIQTLPQTGTTTNLLSRQYGVRHPPLLKRRFRRRLFNPIDYTTVSKADKNALIPPPPPPPYAPIPSRLPQVASVVLRIWSEKAISNKYILLSAIMSLQAITGIRPDPVFATFSDAAKKIREGMPMGARVRLTGPPMYEFLDKLTQCVLPRIREWEGINPVGDSAGKISFTLPDTAVGYFPDIEPHFDSFPRLFDTEVIVQTTGKSDWETTLCLSGFQIPFLEQRVEEKVVADPDANDPWAQFKKLKTKEERKAFNEILRKAASEGKVPQGVVPGKKK
ncbi:hypothetical protein HK097_009043 [Rhizophlyctis rosea]|uniref:Large ribosomal subunit protein uL5 C-terminal domain-containing protein n=1 Tax=Rhizophlyctis rosea TaxID=64517 RepID=A0AAD5SJF8_9FUNG|nr:hypothetical protein HK097_009043 [Rhizophlyctis rosea]